MEEYKRVIKLNHYLIYIDRLCYFKHKYDMNLGQTKMRLYVFQSVSGNGRIRTKMFSYNKIPVTRAFTNIAVRE